MVKQSPFGDYTLYTIEADELRFSVTDLGATAVSLRYHGKETLIGYDSPEGYLAGDAYVGAAIGRYANRIAGARFTLNGVEYTLPANEGKNQLHGGPDSYDKRRWTAEITREDAVRFTLFSPDGDNGFPGNLTAALTYSLAGDTLRLDFEGVSDADTVYAPTSHMYFNLGGEGNALDARLWLNASRYLEVDEGLIPTEIRDAEGDFDFRKRRPLGQNYDHCFLLDGELGAVMRQGGIRMDVSTDFPALQIYTGAFLPKPFAPNQGLAIEPEFYPDSPNRPDFPSTTLKAGERFHRWAEYRFAEA